MEYFIENLLTGSSNSGVWKNRDFPPISRFMSEIVQDRAIVMVWLREGEKSLMICLAVSIKYRRVTDGRTDGVRTDILRQRMIHWASTAGGDPLANSVGQRDAEIVSLQRITTCRLSKASVLYANSYEFATRTLRVFYDFRTIFVLIYNFTMFTFTFTWHTQNKRINTKKISQCLA